ncbi:MAG TPA: YggT family protein [Actinomycetota bacterium]|nr:YggT family protein [Actinomycetota bacterium]
MIFTILYVLLVAYWIVLIVRVVSSWVRIPPSGPVARFMSFVYEITEPVLRPLRNLIPPIRMGMMALDLSAIIVFIVLSILIQYVGALRT